jgi:hypothetical protein
MEGSDYVKKRKCELFEFDAWREIEFNLLLKGDKFRLIEPTGELVKDNDGNTEFIASSNVYNEDGLWMVNIQCEN